MNHPAHIQNIKDKPPSFFLILLSDRNYRVTETILSDKNIITANTCNIIEIKSIII